MDRVDFENLNEKCIWFVSRELARPIAATNKGPNVSMIWDEETKKARTQAILKIAGMSNLQLLELIGQVLQDA